MKDGDRPNVCCTALVASSETISRTASAASVPSGRPHSASTSVTYLRASATDTGALGRVSEDSWWSAIATPSLSHRGSTPAHRRRKPPSRAAARALPVPSAPASDCSCAPACHSCCGGDVSSTKKCIYLSPEAVNSATRDRICAAHCRIGTGHQGAGASAAHPWRRTEGAVCGTGPRCAAASWARNCGGSGHWPD